MGDVDLAVVAVGTPTTLLRGGTLDAATALELAQIFTQIERALRAMIVPPAHGLPMGARVALITAALAAIDACTIRHGGQPPKPIDWHAGDAAAHAATGGWW